MRKYFTIEKKVGETPLQATLRLRELHKLNSSIPLAYAGRLDPMASGKLLILVGDECKRQEKYHSLDKEYIFEVLFGVHSDTGDVLGIIETCDTKAIDEEQVQDVLLRFIGNITLPYPHFSAKTVGGKPLHMWTLEKRLDEIEIPVKESRIYKIVLNSLRTITRSELCKNVLEKIETIPTVTDERKVLGRDFRRTEVRKCWNDLERSPDNNTAYYIANITCVASSGTYMRSLAEVIGKKFGTCGLAYSIHRTTIGKYFPLGKHFGFWLRRF